MKRRTGIIIAVITLITTSSVGALVMPLTITCTDSIKSDKSKEGKEHLVLSDGSVSEKGKSVSETTVFHQRVNVGEHRVIDEQIILDPHNINLRCKLGKLRHRELPIKYHLNMISKRRDDKSPFLNKFDVSGSVKLKIGERILVATHEDDKLMRQLFMELGEPEKIIPEKILYSSAESENLRITLKLQDYFDPNANPAEISNQIENPNDLFSSFDKLKPRRIIFQQSVSASESSIFSENIKVNDTIITFKCKLGKLDKNKISTECNFTLGTEFHPGIHSQQISVNSSVSFELGNKQMIGGLFSKSSMLGLTLDISKPDREVSLK